MGRKPTLTLLRWWGALFGLGLYFLASTPVSPLVAAALACWDDEHTVALVSSGESVRVVLGHESWIVRRSVTHHHCPLAQALVAFSEPTSSRQPDHVLAFCGQLPTLADRERVVLSRRVVMDGSSAASFCPPSNADSFTQLNFNRSLPEVTESPPRLSLLVLRTTIFQV